MEENPTASGGKRFFKQNETPTAAWSLEVLSTAHRRAVLSTDESTAAKRNAPEKSRERFVVAGSSCDSLLSLSLSLSLSLRLRLPASTSCVSCRDLFQPDPYTGIDNDIFLQVRVDPADNGLSDFQRRLDEPASLVVVPVSAAGGSATGWSREVGREAVSNIGE